MFITQALPDIRKNNMGTRQAQFRLMVSGDATLREIDVIILACLWLSEGVPESVDLFKPELAV